MSLTVAGGDLELSRAGRHMGRATVSAICATGRRADRTVSPTWPLELAASAWQRDFSLARPSRILAGHRAVYDIEGPGTERSSRTKHSMSCGEILK